MRFHLRRRRLLLSGFQLRFVVEHLSFLLLLGLVVAMAVFGPLVMELRETGGTLAAGYFLWLHTWFWPVALVAAAIAAAHAVWISHRIAGPLYRFERIFEQIAAGDVSARVRIRRGDYLTAEASAFDAALAALRSRVGACHGEVAHLIALVPRLESLSAGDRALLESSLAQLHHAAGALVIDGAARQDAAAETAAASPARERARASGFTLPELLIVVGLIAVLGVIGVPTYMTALERARITRAIGDIRAIETELRVHHVLSGSLPAQLSEVRQTPTPDPWGRDYVYTNLTTIKGKGKARKDRFLNPLNSDFDLYSVGKDGASVTPLTAKASRDDIVRANDGGFIGLASEY